MRKIFFLVLLISATFYTYSQSKLGLKFSPSISTNRISLIDSLYDVEASGSNFKFSLGLIYDHEITETYYFSTGLIFVPKYVGFEAFVEPEMAGDTTYSGNPMEEYRLNYLQIPLSLKLFTNEVQPDMRIYFQVGLAGEFRVFSEPIDEDYNLIEEFKGMDMTILGGAGVEYRAGINTTLFGGITYQRGLGNVVKNLTTEFQEDLFIRNTVVSLDIGLKF